MKHLNFGRKGPEGTLWECLRVCEMSTEIENVVTSFNVSAGGARGAGEGAKANFAGNYAEYRRFTG